MKKSFLIIFIIVFAFQIGLVSCNKSISEVKETPVNTEAINNESSDLVINVPSSKYYKKYSHYDEWTTFIKETYDIDVKVNYIPITDYFAFTYGNYIAESISDNTISGLIRLGDEQINKITELKEGGYILPFNDYIKDNKNINSLPDEMLQGYSIDDQIWALPGGYYNLPSLRLISNSILEETESKVPSTLDELYVTLMNFKMADKQPLIIGTSTNNPYSYYVKDIFYANGNYISYDGKSSISYNPNNNSYEDFMFSDNVVESLNYINLLLQNELIYKSDVTRFDDFVKDSSYGTFYQELFSSSYEENYSYVWGLTGNNDKYLNPSLSSYYAFVMASNTNDPLKTTNNFINTFIVDKEGYLSSYLGLENKTYMLNNNSDVVRISGEDRIGLTHMSSIHLANGTTNYLYDTGEEVYQGFAGVSTKVQELLDVDKLFPYTYNMFNDDQENSVNQLFGNMFKNFIDSEGELNIDEFIEEYKGEARKAGIENIITNINNKFNTSINLKY
ncbi:MAG: hypothetical protein KAG94_04155 [Clostridiales bacterium]|nr:hypothetical protein [Clostridiales bacterium]